MERPAVTKYKRVMVVAVKKKNDILALVQDGWKEVATFDEGVRCVMFKRLPYKVEQ